MTPDAVPPSEAKRSRAPQPSKVEIVKEASRQLRGTVADELRGDSNHFTEDGYHVLKFHGIYQQDERDRRKELRGTGEKEWIFMIRSKIPGGVLTAQQYLAHDDVASTFANGTLRITTRQDFQLHGVLKHDLRTILRGLHDSGVTTLGACGDLERNVMCCPAPLRDRMSSEVQRFTLALSNKLLPQTRAYQEIWLNGEKVAWTAEDEPEEPLYGKTYLPKKLKMGMAFPGDNCIDVYSHDIGIVPIVEDDRLSGFTILVGGGMAMTHGIKTTYPRLASLLGTVTPALLPLAIEAIVIVQRDFGDRSNRKHARMKYLVEERGVEWFRDEVQRRLGWRLQDPAPIPRWTMQDHLGWHEQGDGCWFLGIPVENGRVKDIGGMQLKTALRVVAERFKPGIRLTPQQNILLTDIAWNERPGIEGVLKQFGVQPAEELSPVMRAAMACPALPTCGLALAEAERVLPPIIRGIESELERLGLRDELMSVRMTGCPNGCTRPYLGDVGIVGKTPGHYNVYLGGDFEGTRLNELYAEMVPQDEIVRLLSPLFRAFRAERRDGERFGDYCNRVGGANLERRFHTQDSAGTA